jgi:hypothetical protein
MPPTINSFTNLIQMVRTGDTEITLAVSAALAGGITAWHHWQAVKEKGHFDQIDDECAQMAGLSEADVQHLNNDLPRGLKERIRRFFISREEDVAVTVKHQPLHPDEEAFLDVQAGEGAITLVVNQPIK